MTDTIALMICVGLWLMLVVFLTICFFIMLIFTNKKSKGVVGNQIENYIQHKEK